MNKWRKCSAFLLGMGILFLGSREKVIAAKTPESLNLTKSNVNLTVGKSLTVKSSGEATVNVIISPYSSNKGIEVSSNDTKLVRIIKISDTFYRLKGLKEGKASITVKSAGNSSLSKKLSVTVKKKAKRKLGVRKLTSSNFEKEIEKKKGRAVIMIGTSWCGYCLKLDPIFKEAAKKDAKVRYYMVDGEEERYGLVELFGVGGFPSVYLVENQRTIQITGYVPEWTAEDYVSWANADY